MALTLNVALILFGWRRYVDLQHETERRIEGERRAAIAASTDPVTGLLNRKGFADEAEELREKARASGDKLLDRVASASSLPFGVRPARL